MKRVIIETPYSGDVEANLKYARECMVDSLYRGEAPIAFHTLYTQLGVLDDSIDEQREMGIAASQQWYPHAEEVIMYLNRGLSPGMIRGVQHAINVGYGISARIFTNQECVNSDFDALFEKYFDVFIPFEYVKQITPRSQAPVISQQQLLTKFLEISLARQFQIANRIKGYLNPDFISEPSNLFFNLYDQCSRTNQISQFSEIVETEHAEWMSSTQNRF